MTRNSLSPAVFPDLWAAAWGQDVYGLWQTLRLGTAEQTFRWIPPGSYWMGSPQEEKGRNDNELRRLRTLETGYWLADTACTQALWQVVMGSNPAHFSSDPLRPVERVSWDDVQVFLQQLSEQVPGLQPRLPDETEWEYACRAGTDTAFHWGDEISLDQANFNGYWDEWFKFTKEAPQETRPVRSYPCNAWGLYEMHGNVWEWCVDVPDWADAGEREAGRVVRGGCWSNGGRGLRSAGRGRDRQSGQDSRLGFRFSPGHRATVQTSQG